MFCCLFHILLLPFCHHFPCRCCHRCCNCSPSSHPSSTPPFHDWLPHHRHRHFVCRRHFVWPLLAGTGSTGTDRPARTMFAWNRRSDPEAARMWAPFQQQMWPARTDHHAPAIGQHQILSERKCANISYSPCISVPCDTLNRFSAIWFIGLMTMMIVKMACPVIKKLAASNRVFEKIPK